MNKLENLLITATALGTFAYGGAAFARMEDARANYTAASQAFAAGDTSKGNVLMANAGRENSQGLLDFGSLVVYSAAFAATVTTRRR